MLFYRELLKHKWAFIVATTLGGVIYVINALWPMISDFYISEIYTPNVILKLNTEDIYLGKNSHLLVIHTQPTNRGNVPVVISDKDKQSFELEIRKVDLPEKNTWLTPEKYKLISKINLLSGYEDQYKIEVGDEYDEVKAIRLENGIYWINATLADKDGEFMNQSEVIELSDRK